MKWTNTVAKAVVISAAALWLAGCASNGPAPAKSMAGATGTGEMTGTMGTMTHGVNDPAVMAVIKSGMVKGTPQQIADLLKDRTFYYDTDKYAVNPTDYAALNATAALMQTPMMKGKQLVIEGNTDERGTRTYNMALGFRRAAAVERYLEAKGVSKDQVRAISYGFDKPVDPAHNSQAWAKNRRVHLVLQDMSTMMSNKMMPNKMMSEQPGHG